MSLIAIQLACSRSFSYTEIAMDVSIAEAKERLPELIHAVEEGENVVITRDGKPVAQIALPAPLPERRKVRFDTMRGRIHLKPGWDDPIDEDQFLSGDF
jgi:antitoxin (DNA-binding transcriptional repressor) of toxin-antitoxin stability system